MSLKLSIVIPCYNCESTLREAVESCYIQGLDDNDFEIVMVDDGSSDGTCNLMKVLADEHSNIRLLHHETNRGGGAARNTGIQSSTGEIIYCLDSDNFFSAQSVPQMLVYLEETKSDGVAFYDRRFFYGTNVKRYTSHFNTILDKVIALSNLFDDSNTLLDNFFYTKESYLRTEGYPEHHGFDTQCFEMRYLSAGNVVRVVPNSIFYHRQAMKERSYFERVHESGMFSINFMLIFEELFHLFNDETIKKLINSPIFTQTSSYGSNPLNTIKSILANGGEIFTENYQDYLLPNGLEKWNSLHSHTSIHLAHVLYAIKKGEYSLANQYLGEYLTKNQHTGPYLQFLDLRIHYGCVGTPSHLLVKETLSAIKNLTLSPIKPRGGALGEIARRNTFLRYIRSLFK